MKILNQIESEVAGEVKAIIAENGHPVEYGEPLFVIDTAMRDPRHRRGRPPIGTVIRAVSRPGGTGPRETGRTSDAPCSRFEPPGAARSSYGNTGVPPAGGPKVRNKAMQTSRPRSQGRRPVVVAGRC